MFGNVISKLIIAAAIFAVGVYVGDTYDFLPKFQETLKETLEQESGAEVSEAVRVMLDFGDGSIKTFNDVLWQDEQTVFGVLTALAERGDIELSSKDFGGELGVFIESIDARPNQKDEGKWWQYWMNNEYAHVGVSSYSTKPGDIISFKLTTGQEK